MKLHCPALTDPGLKVEMPLAIKLATMLLALPHCTLCGERPKLNRPYGILWGRPLRHSCGEWQGTLLEWLDFQNAIVGRLMAPNGEPIEGSKYDKLARLLVGKEAGKDGEN